jgi:cytoskeletal protein RodZ
MKSAGLILQSARLAKKLDFEDVSRITKIRPNFLQAIESDDYTRLPSGATARGFIRNYAEYLGLDPLHVLAVFRRDFVENQSGQIVPRSVVEPAEKLSFWTPKTSIVASVVAIFVLFGGYLLHQYLVLTGPPYLKVDQPQDQLTTAELTVEVSGTTDPEATISVNGRLVALDKGGTFFLRLPVESGPNTITVTATSKSGKSSTVNRTVTLTPSP